MVAKVSCGRLQRIEERKAQENKVRRMILKNLHFGNKLYFKELDNV